MAGVLVVDESRLARDELVAALIRDRLKRSGTRLATLRGELDLTDPSENFMANVLAAAHAFEQDMRTMKMKSGLRNTAAAGYWTGGPPPYGYRLVLATDGSKHNQLAINDGEASLLRLVADLMVNRGFTTYSAARYVNEHGLRTRGIKHKDPDKSGPRQWRHPNLRHQMRKRHLTGTWVYKQAINESKSQYPPYSPKRSGIRFRRLSKASHALKGRTGCIRSPVEAVTICNANAEPTSLA